MTDVGFRNQRLAQSGSAPPAWQPSDVRLLAANFELPASRGLGGVSAGFLYLAKLHIRSSLTLSTLWFGVQGSNSGTGSVNAGLYSQAGNLLTDCGNVGPQFNLGAYAQCSLTSPQSLTSWAWAALLSNMSGAQAQPTGGDGTAATANLALPAAQAEFACGGNGFASLPATLNFANFATFSGAALPIWVGGS
jgi:hypothetical protein